MKKVTVGIVGCGFAADLHVRALRMVKGIEVEIIGVASRTNKSSENFARRFGIKKHYTDYRYLLEDKNIDVIDVCTPNYLHKRICVESAQAGKHIICEKPLTGYFGEDISEEVEFVGTTVSKLKMYKEAMRSADAILQAVKENDVKLAYAEDFVYAPAVEKAKRLIMASRGVILHMRAEESHSGSHAPYSRIWRLSGGGALLRLGSHPLGVVIHLKNFEGTIKRKRPIKIKSVMAQTANLTHLPSFKKEKRKWVVSDWKDVEDWATAILTFEDGTKATIFSNDITLGGVVNVVEIYLSNSVIKCNLSQNDTCKAYAPSPEVFGEEYITEKIETKAGWSFPSPDEDWMRGYPQEMQDFIESVYYDRNPISDGELGRQVVQAVYAAYVSAEEGREIRIENIEEEYQK